MTHLIDIVPIAPLSRFLPRAPSTKFSITLCTQEISNHSVTCLCLKAYRTISFAYLPYLNVQFCNSHPRTNDPHSKSITCYHHFPKIPL